MQSLLCSNSTVHEHWVYQQGNKLKQDPLAIIALSNYNGKGDTIPLLYNHAYQVPAATGRYQILMKKATY